MVFTHLALLLITLLSSPSLAAPVEGVPTDIDASTALSSSVEPRGLFDWFFGSSPAVTIRPKGSAVQVKGKKVAKVESFWGIPYASPRESGCFRQNASIG